MVVRISQVVFAGLVALVMTLAPAVARAGGVIIDGRIKSTLSVDTQTDEQSAQPEDTASESTNSSWESPADEPADPQTDEPGGTMTQTEQELYIFAALVLHGHDASENPGELSGTSDEDDNTMASIIGDLDGEPAGGCAATPVSGLGAIAAMALLRRRRRVNRRGHDPFSRIG
ncbi:MAG: hypothetical protein V3T05_11830 [Myxococcota bacterium]